MCITPRSATVHNDLISYSAAFGTHQIVIKSKHVLKAGLNMKSGWQPGGQPKFWGPCPQARRNADDDMCTLHLTFLSNYGQNGSGRRHDMSTVN